MKVTSLKISNIGLIESEELKLDKPLILFYGEIRQGKTTILNAVRWVCGGPFPGDIIRHGQKEGFIELGFDGGCIRREWYVSKKSPFETKAREVAFVKNGKPVSNPVAEIKRLLNPFLLNQDYLRNMTDLERNKYFVQMFSVDTVALDKEAYNASVTASDLRSKLTGYGDIDLTEVKPVDTTALKKQLAEIRAGNATARAEWEARYESAKAGHAAKVKAANDANLNADVRGAKRSQCKDRISEIQAQIAELQKKESELVKWLDDNPAIPATTHPKELIFTSQPMAKDTSELETNIQNAAAQNVRAEQYAKNQKRLAEKQADEANLRSLELRQREIKAEKIAKLATISEACGIKDLAFDESGQFTFQGTQAGMLSTSQIMLLSSQLSTLYPEGLGVELLDRAESLGKSIFEFVDRAKENELTILATIVGESPAEASSEIGVFVVKNGKVMESELAKLKGEK